MASKEELLAEKNAIQARLKAAAGPNGLGSLSPSKRLAYMKKTETDRKRLVEVENQIKGEAPTPPKSKTPYVLPKNPLASNAPANLPADVVQELLNNGVDITNNGVWQSQGVGATSLVWLADSGSTGKLEIDPITGKPKNAVISNTKYAPTLANSWWSDPALQKKIMNAYAAKGQNLSLVEGFNLWQGLVTTAASIYNGGRGAKITPFDLLSDSLKNVKVTGRQTSIDTTIRKYSDAEVTTLINQNLRSVMPRNATPEEIKSWLPDLKKKLEEGTVTKTVPVGTNNTKTYTNPSFSEADIASYIKDKVSGTQDYAENKSQGFMDFISRNR